MTTWRPMLATPLGRRDVSGPQWQHEFKWDGIRVIMQIRSDNQGGDGLRLLTRNGNDVALAWPELQPLAGLVPKGTVIDGEVVVLDDHLRPDFSGVAARMHVRDPHRVARLRRSHPGQFMAFDLLAVAGNAVVTEPLETRRARLLDVMPPDGGPWAVPPAVDDLEDIMAVVVDRELEGIVSKRRGSPYRPGARSPDWRKWRRAREVDAVVVGWKGEQGATTGPVASLALARWDSDTATWVAMGSVGSGISTAEGWRLHDVVAGLDASAESPAEAGTVPRGFVPVSPRVVVRVRYLEATPAGQLRHPVYIGQRPDAAAHDVTEAP